MSQTLLQQDSQPLHQSKSTIQAPHSVASKKQIGEEYNNSLEPPRINEGKNQRVTNKSIYMIHNNAIEQIFDYRKVSSCLFRNKIEEKRILQDKMNNEFIIQYNQAERRKLKEHQLSLIKQMNAKYTQSMDSKSFGKVFILSTSVKPVKNQELLFDPNPKRQSMNSINLESFSNKQTYQKVPFEYEDKKRYSIQHNLLKPIGSDSSIFFTGVDNIQRSQSNIKGKKIGDKSNTQLPQLVEEHNGASLILNSKNNLNLPTINQGSMLGVYTPTYSKDVVPYSNQPSIIQAKRLLETKKDYEDKEPQYERTRDFRIRVEQKQFLFEGLKFVQFESFVIKEPAMQGLVVRDVLKILGDKSIAFKNYLIDRNKMRKVFGSLSYSCKISTNVKFEQLIGLLEKIAIIISQDFMDYKDFTPPGENPLEEYRKKAEEFYRKAREMQLEQEELLNKKNELLLQFASPKVRGSPQNDSFFQNNARKTNPTNKNIVVPQSRIKDSQEFIKIPMRYDKKYPYYRPYIDTVKQEPYVFEDNIQLYDKVADFIKDCIDSFRVLSRQREFKQLNDSVCEELLKLVTQTRYFLSEFGEELRMFEKNNEDKIKWQKYYEQEKQRNEYHLHNQSLTQTLPHLADSIAMSHTHHGGTEEKKQEEVEKDKNEKLEFIYRVQKLTSILFNKFNYKRNRFQTRESKVILNQDKFDKEKELLLESNDIEAAMKNKTIADNRKLVAIKRLRQQDDVDDLKMGNQLQGASYFKAFEVSEHH